MYIISYKETSQKLIKSYKNGDISIFALIGATSFIGRIAHEESKEKKSLHLKQFIEKNKPFILTFLNETENWLNPILENEYSKENFDIESTIHTISNSALQKKVNGNIPDTNDIQFYFNLKEKLINFVKSSTFYDELEEIKAEYRQKENDYCNCFSEIEDDELFNFALERIESMEEEIYTVAKQILSTNPDIESAFQQATDICLRNHRVDSPEVREIFQNNNEISKEIIKINNQFDKLQTTFANI